ncbi:hypothetical protein SBD_2218 [Streptomyces bottropensis ATCC 25435]|uniref:Uncharacterized protein n=1 Tax=Streptomyces bottropensis ATCC 25435 TaxID=1054862 RepID=M3DI59_9ACTN|nr:hypothetical protein SBD_2218 [Streptomyces bottropensis ATCC 25435]
MECALTALLELSGYQRAAEGRTKAGVPIGPGLLLTSPGR